MPDIDAPALAARVQGLIQGRFGGDVGAAAQALGVDEKNLRDIVEHATDRPSLDTLAAIIRRFGVDACWLLTGEYDWKAHRLQLVREEEEGGSDAPRGALHRLVAPNDQVAANDIAKRIA